MSTLLAPPPPPARRLAANVRLVAPSFISAERGVSTDTVLELIESGILWPAFDLGARGEKDHTTLCRVWRGALDRTTACTGNTDARVREAIEEACYLPNTSATIAGVVLEVTWQVSRETLMRLRESGEIKAEVVGRRLHVNRASAAAFLKRRLLK